MKGEVDIRCLLTCGLAKAQQPTTFYKGFQIILLRSAVTQHFSTFFTTVSMKEKERHIFREVDWSGVSDTPRELSVIDETLERT